MDSDRIAERLTDEVRRRLIDAGMPEAEAAGWRVIFDLQRIGPDVAGEAPTDNDR